MNAWLSSVESWLLDFACLSTALLAAAVVMRLLLRDPGGRVMLAWGTWLAIAVGGVLIAAPLWPRYGLSRLLPQRPIAAAVIIPETAVQSVEPIVISEPLEATPSPADAEGPIESIGTSLVPAKAHEDLGAEFWWRMVVGSWLASAAAAIFWILVGFGQAWMLVRRSKCAPQWIADELRQIAGLAGSLAEVCLSPELSSAVALGALRPRILLPEASAVESNTKAICAALAHEWAHIRHGDLWLLALERLLLPLLALHPLFWWLRRSTRLDQELLADAAAAGEQPVEYAEALVAWAKAPADFRGSMAALAMWERPSNLSRRVQMILSNKRVANSWIWRFYGGLAACAVVCAGAALSTMSVRTLGADDEPAVAGEAAEPPAKTPAAVESGEAIPNPAAAPKGTEKAITLKVALLVLDRGDIAENTRKQVTEAVERLTGRPMYEAFTSSTVKTNSYMGKSSARTLTAEVDNDQSGDLALDIQSVTGVKLVSRSKVITLDGQETHIQLTEPGGSVTEEEINGEKARRVELFTEIGHSLRIKPQALGNGSMLNLDVHISRERPRGDQRSGEFKTAAQMGRTLVVVSSEPYAILITPVKVEPQVVSQSATSGERHIGFPILPAVPAPPVRAAPATTAVETTPAVVRRAQVALPQSAENIAVPIAPYRAPAVPATTPLPAGSQTPVLAPKVVQVPVIPGLPITPAATPPSGTVIPPLPSAAEQHLITPPVAARTNAGAEGRALFTIPIIENASEVAAKLRQRLQERGIDGMEVSSDPRTNSILIMGTFSDAREIPKLLSQLGATFNKTVGRELVETGRQGFAVSPTDNVRELSPQKSSSETQRKLLELDLQEAQLNLEVAKVELESIQKIRAMNPSAASQQELRKRQLEVDRATIQVKRIQVQLDAEKESAEPASKTPKGETPALPRRNLPRASM